MTTRYAMVDSPLGRLLLTGEESATAPGGTALTSLSLAQHQGGAPARSGLRCDPAAFAEAERQLRAYFAGELREFNLEFAVRGTAFRERVWAALEAIPYGATLSYGALAERIGAPRAAVRAVGGALGANPLLIVRPCHRVIGAGGGLTGYAGGLERKEALLALEGARGQSPAGRSRPGGPVWRGAPPCSG